ncbi:MAG: hypothetical protein GY834_04895 [Bacteroidetes bacterium]|nr:hypothetical protein [Bacteroidota bacterium]
MNKDKLPNWTRVSIEIFSSCNRDCYFCPRYLDRSGVRKDSKGEKKIEYMPTEKVYDLIDQVAELGYKGNIGFHRLSESFLDSRIFDFISYAKKKGMKYLDSTNGDVLKSNLNLCNMLDGVADCLIIGLYDYKNNLEKQKEIDFWKKRFKKSEIRFSLPLENMRIRQNSKVYNEVNKNMASLDQPCFRTKDLKIRYDGNVSLCCQDDLCNFNLGNVFLSSIEEIWLSDKHIKLVNDLKKPGSRHKYDLCKRCYIPDIKKNKSKETIKKLHQKITRSGLTFILFQYGELRKILLRILEMVIKIFDNTKCK